MTRSIQTITRTELIAYALSLTALNVIAANIGLLFFAQDSNKNDVAKIAALGGFFGTLFSPAIIPLFYFAGKKVCDDEFNECKTPSMIYAHVLAWIGCIASGCAGLLPADAALELKDSAPKTILAATAIGHAAMIISLQLCNIIALCLSPKTNQDIPREPIAIEIAGPQTPRADASASDDVNTNVSARNA